MKVKQLLYAFILAFLLALHVNGQNTAQPSFPVRGFHIDLRIQVMQMPALKQLALQLSKEGINTIIMEWEGTYPFSQEPLIPNRYAYTREQITDFIAYCKHLGIDVIPLQQSFGHVEYILRNYRYAELREDQKDFSQVCPSKTELNRALFTKLFTDMAATHQSPYIHIGCDETHLLGHCPICQKRAAEEGISKLYFDHVKMLCAIVTSLGKRPVLWADIALKYPQYIHLLPKETVFVDWNYGWGLDNFGNHQNLMKSGYEIWGAPAIRSGPDNFYLTNWRTHFGNIHSFIPQSRELGYKGIIMTSWSTSGEYGALFDSGNELKDLYAVRHVYPISGFNILISAFEQAYQQQNALNIDDFITSYCRTRYGLDEKSAAVFKKALFTTQYRAVNGKALSPSPVSMSDLLDSARFSSSVMHQLNPIKNTQEFEHYRLMADIRTYYLTYQNIEAEVNAAQTKGDLDQCATKLNALMATEPALDKKFAQLNEQLLYPAAIKEENDIRNYKTHQLYERLTREK